MKCQRIGCTHQADRAPKLRFWALGYPKTAGMSAEAVIQIWHCRDCAEKTTLADIVNEDGWRAIRAQLMKEGKAEPDRASLELHWWFPRGSNG